MPTSLERNRPRGGTRQEVPLTLAHSPDSDDAFMFYALATRKIPTGNFQFSHTLEDIESLNRKALEGIYDITAVSFHGYAYLSDRYVLLTTGASFGEGYGPVVVACNGSAIKSLKGRRVAVPGKMTSAFLALRLYEPDIEPIETPFDKIFDAVAAGHADAGVIIHEGQLTYGSQGLAKVVDLGEWWQRETRLPLPLGGNVIRRSLGEETLRLVNKILRASIQFGLEHRDEAIEYAMQFARGLDSPGTDHFVSMYVNHWTLDYGERGREAVQALLDRGHAAGIIPQPVKAEFVD
jgi:5,8-dihydroxy-2-naphthoate synthase